MKHKTFLHRLCIENCLVRVGLKNYSVASALTTIIRLRAMIGWILIRGGIGFRNVTIAGWTSRQNRALQQLLLRLELLLRLLNDIVTHQHGMLLRLRKLLRLSLDLLLLRLPLNVATAVDSHHRVDLLSHRTHHGHHASSACASLTHHTDAAIRTAAAVQSRRIRGV